MVAKKFIGALPNVPLGKLMLLLKSFPNEVIESESDVSTSEYEGVLKKVEAQRMRISSNSNLFLPALSANDEENQLSVPNTCEQDMLLTQSDPDQQGRDQRKGYGGFLGNRATADEVEDSSSGGICAVM